jgi:hypothetical protein
VAAAVLVGVVGAYFAIRAMVEMWACVRRREGRWLRPLKRKSHSAVASRSDFKCVNQIGNRMWSRFELHVSMEAVPDCLSSSVARWEFAGLPHEGEEGDARCASKNEGVRGWRCTGKIDLLAGGSPCPQSREQ